MLFQLFLLFQSIGMFFLIGSLVFFFIGKDAAMKRKLLPPFFVVGGVQAVGMAYFSQGLIAALIVTALAVFVSQKFMRHLKICDPCGRIVNDYYGNVPKECPSCHASVPNGSVASVII